MRTTQIIVTLLEVVCVLRVDGGRLSSSYDQWQVIHSAQSLNSQDERFITKPNIDGRSQMDLQVQENENMRSIEKNHWKYGVSKSIETKNNERYGVPDSERIEFDREKYGGFDRSDHHYCHDKHVSFYRNFDEAVSNITHDARIDSPEDGCMCTSGVFILCNCSSSNMSSVPRFLITETNGIDLSDNRIQNLDGLPFQRYPELTYLSLRNNSITRLSLQDFHGLTKLQVLDLKNNRLSMSSGTYPVGVFKVLSSLVALRINRNHNDVHLPGLFYPDEALADLKSLRILTMDGLSNKTFGEGFGHLHNLETLSVSGYSDGNCRLISLTNQTFRNLTQLKMLNVSDCYIEDRCIDPKSLQYLKNLHTLDFSWNEAMSIQMLGEILGELTDSELKELFARRVEWRFSPGATLGVKQAKNLPRNLTCLVASGNSISRLQDGVLDALPDTLRYLDFSGNKLVFGRYLQNLYKLQSLEVLLLNGAEYTFEIPHTYQFESNDAQQRQCTSQANQEKFRESERQNRNISRMKLRLPPKLRVLEMKFAGLWYFLSELNVHPNNSLEELVLSNNYFPWIRGPFRGFDKLKKLVMSSCSIKDMSKQFFENFKDLEYLDLHGNLIGDGYSLFHRPFSNLTNLRYLDLGFNDILHLSNDSFSGLPELRKLHINNNTLFEFNARISGMSNLEVLDFRATSIHTLNTVTRSHIDKLQNMSVLLSATPIYCDCSNIDFLDWMTQDENGVISIDTTFMCVLKDRATLFVNWHEFIAEVKVIRRECTPNYLLFLAVLGATLLLLVLVIGSVMYRFRWRIRYLYYGIHLWITSRNVDGDRNRFSFDVFISYANEDLNFVLGTICPELHRRGLTTCIHSRDFKAGENIITNIIRAVKVSKKTLVVLTNNFISSKWCRAEFQMAKEEAVVSGRKTLVFLIADQIPKSKIGLELLSYLQQNTYIPYHGQVDNSEPSHYEAEGGEEHRSSSPRETKVWDKLVRDITG